MSSPLLSFVWFTFGGDAACLRWSLCSVRAIAPGAARHVFFDPDQPLPPDLIWELSQEGVHIRPSAGPHGRNLNGQEHLERQLDALAAAAPPDNTGMVVKIDSDTVVQSLDWLAPALIPENPFSAIGFSATHPPQPLCGPCYALRADVPRRLRHTLAAPPQPLAFLPGLPEDHCVSTLLDATLQPLEILRLPTWPKRAFFAGYQYPDDADAPLQGLYRAISVVTFGNRSLIPGTEPEKRAAAARAMELLLDA
ncbi:MAG: hypothetical protein V4726_11010 [Verrucomicrobiota bacterium]